MKTPNAIVAQIFTKELKNYEDCKKYLTKIEYNMKTLLANFILEKLNLAAIVNSQKCVINKVIIEF